MKRKYISSVCEKAYMNDFGIDIGTSQCSVAYWNISVVEILRNGRDEKLMPSFVTFKDKIPSCGVRNTLSLEQEMLSGSSVFNMKRFIGRVNTDHVFQASKSLPFLVQSLDIGVPPLIAVSAKHIWRYNTPDEVLAVFLIELRVVDEAQLLRPVRNVVLHHRRTFADKSLSRKCNRRHFLQNMMRYILPNYADLFLRRENKDIESMGLLRVATQDAINKLSFEESVELEVELVNGTRVHEMFSLGEFEALSEAVRSSNILKLRNLVKNICRKELYKGMKSLDAAVSGATLDGAVNTSMSDPFGNLDLRIFQVTPLGIGIRANGNSFVPIIHRNNLMPTFQDRDFTTAHDNQTEALIAVYEGEADKAEDHHLLGYFKIQVFLQHLKELWRSMSALISMKQMT
ncbi:primary amine oxidase-like [Hibiscus syriacus]|uniref:Primary amine oxidase-like n=1 Tax=Hibiscus syriacus TaxID=106335 RepID=A0A6A3CG11_HIBSY|nr:primary amine oxidase-like [Hibiscus syriacus]